ncbi:MAG: ABC transporter substrate-binding protein [Bacilli bacterium]
MRRIHKAFVMAGALLSMGTLLTGFKLTSSSPAVNITVWAFGGVNSEHSWEAKMVTLWNKEHPDIHVTWMNQDWSTKRQKMIAAYETQTLPDIAMLDAPSVPDFVALHMLRPLNQLAPQMVAKWRPLYVPAIWNASLYKGQLYSVPIGYVDLAPMLAYRTDLIHTPPATWQGLIRDAVHVKTVNHVTPIIIPGQNNTNDTVMFEGLLYGNGGRWVSPQGKILINSPAAVQVLQLYKRLYDSGLTQKDPVAMNYWPATEAFLNGQSAMTLVESWVKAIQSSVSGVTVAGKYGVTIFPHNQHVSGPYPASRVLIQPSLNAMVTSTSPYAKQDMEFINWMTSKQFEQGWWGNPIIGRVPAQTRGWYAPSFKGDFPNLSELFKEGVLFKNAQPSPTFAGLPQAEDLLGQAIESVLLNQKTPQQALNQVEAKVQQIYNEFNK